jgi:hypothetical protein
LTEDTNGLSALADVLDKAITAQAVSEGAISDFDTAVSIASCDTSLASEISDAGKKYVVEAIASSGFSSLDDYSAKAETALNIAAFNFNTNQSPDNLSAKLNELNSVLKLNLTKFSALSSSKQATAAQRLAASGCKSVSAMQTTLDKIVSDLTPATTTGGGGGGNGGGGGGVTVGGNNTYTGSMEVSVSEDLLQEAKYVFDDLREAAWVCDAVGYLNERGIVSGYDDNSFKPGKNVSRAEFTTMVVKAFLGTPSENGEDNFADVNAGDWFAPYVNIAFKDGFVSGFDGSFKPNDNITRQDMAVIVYNAAVKFNLIEEIGESEPFGDDSSISDYAKEAVYSLKSLGIVSGNGDGGFAPKSSATRAESAQLIYALMTALQ